MKRYVMSFLPPNNTGLQRELQGLHLESDRELKQEGWGACEVGRCGGRGGGVLGGKGGLLMFT